MKVVARSALLNRTTDPWTKPVPITINVKFPPPDITVLGLSVAIVGTGFGGTSILSSAAFDVPPPGGGVNTVMLAVPGVAMSAAVTAAVNCVLLTNDVTNGLPLKRTTEFCVKFVPFTVSVKPAVPPILLVGSIEVIRGIGAGVAIAKLTEFEFPPPGPGLTTRIVAVPAAAMSEAGICAVSSVLLVKVVTRLLPFH